MRVLCLGLLVGCWRDVPPAAPTIAHVEPAPAPRRTVRCYAGEWMGAGQGGSMFLRLTLDPAGHQIIEETALGTGAGGSNLWTNVFTVDGDQLSSPADAYGLVRSGTLVGPPWRWTQWHLVTTSRDPRFESETDVTITDTRWSSSARDPLRPQDDPSTDALTAIDCAEYERARAELEPVREN